MLKSLVGATLGGSILLAASVAGVSALTVAAPPVALSHRDRLYDVAAVDGDVFVVGHPGRILLERAGSGTLVDVHAGQRDEALFSIAFNAKGQGAIVGRSGYALFSEDKGATWRAIPLELDGERPSLFSVAVLPSGALVAVGEFGLIVRRASDGGGWTRSSFSIAMPALGARQAACKHDSAVDEENGDMLQEARLTDVRFFDDLHGFAVGEFGMILRSVDGGQTFSRQNGCTDKTLYGLSLISADGALAVGAEGTVVETDDAGKNWLPRATGTSEHLFGVHADGARAVVVGAAGTVLERQGGAAFQAVKTSVHTWLTSAWMDTRGHGLIVGGRASVLRTTDGGRTQSRMYGE